MKHLYSSTLARATCVLLLSALALPATAQRSITQWAPKGENTEDFRRQEVILLPSQSNWLEGKSTTVQASTEEFRKRLQINARRVGFDIKQPDFSGQDGLRVQQALFAMRTEVLNTFGDFFLYNNNGRGIEQQTMPLPHPVPAQYSWLADRLGTRYVLIGRALQESDGDRALVLLLVDLKRSEVVARNVVGAGAGARNHLDHYLYLGLYQLTSRER